MFNRLWLLFAQAVTIFLAAWFIAITLKPNWLSGIQSTSLVDSITLREGAYDAGFDIFSHRKSVLQVRGFLGFNLWKGSKLARPPYGKGVERLLRFLK